MSAPVHAGIHTQTPPSWVDTPWVDTLPGPTPPWADTPLPSACWDTPPTQCMLGYTALSSACWDTPPCPVHAGIDMATAADGKHPTGMRNMLEYNYCNCILLPHNFCLMKEHIYSSRVTQKLPTKKGKKILRDSDQNLYSSNVMSAQRSNSNA